MLYSLTQCLLCSEIFKDCPPGYVENGRRGVLHGFYHSKNLRALIVLSVMEVNFRMSKCNIVSFFLMCHVYSLYIYIYIYICIYNYIFCFVL